MAAFLIPTLSMQIVFAELKKSPCCTTECTKLGGLGDAGGLLQHFFGKNSQGIASLLAFNKVIKLTTLNPDNLD